MTTFNSSPTAQSKIKQGLDSVFIMLFGVLGALFATSHTDFYTYAGWAAVFVAAIWLFRLPQKAADREEEQKGNLAAYLPIIGGILVVLHVIGATVGYW